jgi:peptidoglycan/xylan/chitin deacetylase (PgdA/CDA1 family)
LLFSVVTGIAFGLRAGTNVKVEPSTSNVESSSSAPTQTETQTQPTTEESTTEESTTEKPTESTTEAPTEPPRDLNKDPIIPEIIPSAGKTVYLTFDDGPSIYTKEILDILDRYGVKATFFVVNGKQNHLMKEIVNRGHQIGLHTYTHRYDVLYKSEQAYYDDLNKINEVVKTETGVETKLIRFPGGSSNAISKKYSKGLMTKLAASVTEKGYYYYDWNCTNGDAEGAKTVTDQLRYCSKFPRSANEIVVLMHDNKKLTAQSLPYIIEYYKACGMEFGILTPEVTGAHHPINN